MKRNKDTMDESLSKLNVNEKQKLVGQLHAMTSAIISRAELAAKMGMSFGTDRDLYKVCGYPSEEVLDFPYFYSRYKRQETAKRVIDAFVSATWRTPPTICEDEDPQVQTIFEKAFYDLSEEKNLWSYIRRLDTLSGIGQYAVMLIGIDDGLDLSDEVLPGKNRRLLFLQPYSEESALINTWDEDPQSERYNLPHMYNIDLRRGDGKRSVSKQVHWSRVVHVAEGLLEGDVYGTPSLECIYNRLQDLETIVSGSAEMFWQGAFPGIVYSMDKDADPGAQSIAEMDDEIKKYMHKLRRYMKLQGVTPHQLMPNITDPTNYAMMQLKLISAGKGIPLRILLGSERGELASSQDERNWNSRVDERRSGFGKTLLRSIMDRLIYMGILPEPKKYYIEWPDLNSLSSEDQAKVAKLRSETIATYSNALGAQDIYPIDMFLSKELGLSIEEVQLITSQMKEADLELEEGDNA